MGEVTGRLEVSGPVPAARRAPMIWGECKLEDDDVVIRLHGWRRLLAMKGTIRLPLASVVRVDRDPSARAHVQTGIRQWRKHGQGVWRLGTYHGLDGWSFWSIGLGRNAVLIECAGERLHYVVIEVADPERTVREIRLAAGRATQQIPRGPGTFPATPARASRPRERDEREFATGED